MSVNSVMTQLADAIREKTGLSNKLSIPAMTSAVQGIELNTGSDIDLTGVTVTADKLLGGVVAVNSSGIKITGTMPTVELVSSGNTVSVSAGYTSGGAPYGVTWEEMGLEPYESIE